MSGYIVVITAYNVYVCISLVKLVKVLFSLFSLTTGFIIPVNEDYYQVDNACEGRRSVAKKFRKSAKFRVLDKVTDENILGVRR